MLFNALLKKKNILTNFFGSYEKKFIKFRECIDLLKLAEKENDFEFLSEVNSELKELFDKTNHLYFQTLMNGKADSKNAYLEINSGAGGTEAQDWVAMLLRMYSKWCENMGLDIEVMDQTDGEEAGYKSVILRVVGDMSYGWLKRETGVHRLVRISPFDSQSRRHTSFASVGCYPETDKSINITLLDKDLRIDTFRASGAGGQHVNKTDSAVRITHLPTKISVQCQSNRSQHRNKNIAIEMLKSKLYEIQIRKEEELNQKDREKKTQIAWGHQIRSYILQPYQMVKDHRTNIEDSNVNSVLDGKISKFLETQLVKINH